MFNVEKSIQNWRKRLLKHQGLEPGFVEEMESHLRDKIDDLVQKGHSEEDAFHQAVKNFDDPEEIANQFFQARKTKVGLPPWKSKSWIPVMLPNFMKIALRNFARNKAYSMINIAGLALGIASCLLILIYVQHELSFDTFHEKADRIYRINQSNIWGDHSEKFSSTGPAVAGALEAEIPGIESILRIHTPTDFIVTIEQEGQSTRRSFEEKKTLAVDSTFFEIFSFEMIEGNVQMALDQPNSVVLTQEAAERYFDNENPIGKQLTIKSGKLKKSFTITGIVANPPANSHFDFTMLTSMSSFPHVEEREPSWVWTTFVTYILLEENASPEQIRQQLPTVVEKHAAGSIQQIFGLSINEYKEQEGEWNLYMQPLTDIWLDADQAGNRLGVTSDITYVYVFSAVALLIIILACINFMNLSTARSVKRGKEVGVRKTLGSGKTQLIAQFLGESVFYTVLAGIIAVFIVEAVLPMFNQLSGRELEIGYLFTPFYLLGIFTFLVLIGIFAGVYPAFFLTSFSPVNALKGNVGSYLKKKSVSFGSFRNVLVVIQFSVSICLIISSLVIYNQLEFIQTKDLGFNKDHLLVLHNAELLDTSVETFDQILENQPGIQQVSYTNAVPPQIWYEDYYRVYGSTEPAVPINGVLADEEFLPTLDVEFIKGRNFSKDRPADVNGVVLNEAAVQRLHWTNEKPNENFPLGEYIVYDGAQFQVIGVINDFNYRSLYTEVPPLAVFHKDADAWFGPRAFFLARVNEDDDMNATINRIQSYWTENFPQAPFEYTFVNDVLNWSYESVQKAGSIFSIFTFLAIFIACLGLLGLIAFVVEQRTKEIGIRKVMGASTFSIVYLLSSDFAKLVGISFMLASPVAWFMMQEWLQDFEYHISPGLYTFLIGGGIVLTIALITICFQTIKAALANPVKSLRSE
ncbi:ABC transporter permease [Rhodohalobacter sp. 614A]|uniref:ABC transporter permease n=1 Tax=Rhodohalobacter sp. 614A TaxID=2908649 RepID=UPI001F1BD114|nr:ABC transporter permease [Rhodohalobacter sp. 614A]